MAEALEKARKRFAAFLEASDFIPREATEEFEAYVNAIVDARTPKADEREQPAPGSSDDPETWGADAAKWAAAFNRTASNLGHTGMDEGWLIGWFANAIERGRVAHPGTKRERARIAEPEPETARAHIAQPAREDDPVSALVTLGECPEGLFAFGDTYGFKSEYRSQGSDGTWGVDAYCLESGEYFWGGAASHADRNQLMVRPIEWPVPAIDIGKVPDGIYIASKAKHGQHWQTYRSQGFPIISTWIDESGEGQTTDFHDLWHRCATEAASAAVTIVYHEDGETIKGALLEAGAALSHGRRIIVVGNPPGTWVRHRNVTRAPTIESALNEALSLLPKTQDPQ